MCSSAVFVRFLQQCQVKECLEPSEGFSLCRCSVCQEIVSCFASPFHGEKGVRPKDVAKLSAMVCGVVRKGERMKKRIGFAVVLLVFAFVGPGQTEPPPPPKWMASPVKEWVDKARAATKQVTIQELKAAVDAKEDIVILDVREPNEFAVAHIPEAVNIPRGLLEFSIWSVVPDREARIFVYCKTGARAALATKQINDLGYKNAVAVDTGGSAWLRAGYPIQTSISDEEFVFHPAAK